MSRYAIWDKQSPVITPIGKVLSSEQWIQRYPAAGVPTIQVVWPAANQRRVLRHSGTDGADVRSAGGGLLRL